MKLVRAQWLTAAALRINIINRFLDRLSSFVVAEETLWKMSRMTENDVHVINVT